MVRGAGELLAERSWKGMDLSEKVEAQAAVKGRSGIASGYAEETE